MASSYRRDLLSGFLVVAAIAAATSSLKAQTAAPITTVTAPAPGGTITAGTATTNSANAANLRTIPSTPPGIPPSTDYNLQLQWNESQRGVTLTYQNTSTQALTVQGIQSTGNIFIVAFPSSIPAGGSGPIDLVYLAQAGTQADSDIIRLLVIASI
jgi:hypothetical protein